MAGEFQLPDVTEVYVAAFREAWKKIKAVVKKNIFKIMPCLSMVNSKFHLLILRRLHYCNESSASASRAGFTSDEAE